MESHLGRKPPLGLRTLEFARSLTRFSFQYSLEQASAGPAGSKLEMTLRRVNEKHMTEVASAYHVVVLSAAGRVLYLHQLAGREVSEVQDIKLACKI